MITFSNFLTSDETVVQFEPNLTGLLNDSHPGTVVLVIGGHGDRYGKVYERMDGLVTASKFQRKLAGTKVSIKECGFTERVYCEGKRFYERLQDFAPNDNLETQVVREHFEGTKIVSPRASEIRAYRKDRY